MKPQCSNNWSSRDMKITTTTNCIFRSGTLDGGTVFDGWTNVKKRESLGGAELQIADQ